jgi:Domain of unknown function (DUF4190)
VSYPPPYDPNQNPGYQQQPADQPPYYQQPYYQQPYQPVQEHPQATTVLILGILGLVLCQVLGPFALVMGRKTVREIDASGGTLGGRGNAQVGYILGIVGTVLLGFGVLFGIAYVIFFVAFFGSMANSS